MFAAGWSHGHGNALSITINYAIIKTACLLFPSRVMMALQIDEDGRDWRRKLWYMFDINLFREQLRDYFAGQPAVLLAYLFGSHARGQANPLSDLDIGVLHEQSLDRKASFDLRLSLIGDLMGIFHENDVDVVILNEAPLPLAYRVLRDGLLLYARDEQTRILYQADTVSRYLDFKPFVDYQNRAILERARRGELRNGYNPHHGSLERYRQTRKRLGKPQRDDPG